MVEFCDKKVSHLFLTCAINLACTFSETIKSTMAMVAAMPMPWDPMMSMTWLIEELAVN